MSLNLFSPEGFTGLSSSLGLVRKTLKAAACGPYPAALMPQHSSFSLPFTWITVDVNVPA